MRGTVWLAERIQEQAESELYDETSIRTALLELEVAREAGELDEEDLMEAENALVERLMAIRAMEGEANHGPVG